MFKSREHEKAITITITTESNTEAEVSTLDDDDEIMEPYHPTSQERRLAAETHDRWYKTVKPSPRPSNARASTLAANMSLQEKVLLLDDIIQAQEAEKIRKKQILNDLIGTPTNNDYSHVPEPVTSEDTKGRFQ